jgi:hypothetical protein
LVNPPIQFTNLNKELIGKNYRQKIICHLLNVNNILIIPILNSNHWILIFLKVIKPLFSDQCFDIEIYDPLGGKISKKIISNFISSFASFITNNHIRNINLTSLYPNLIQNDTFSCGFLCIFVIFILLTKKYDLFQIEISKMNLSFLQDYFPNIKLDNNNIENLKRLTKEMRIFQSDYEEINIFKNEEKIFEKMILKDLFILIVNFLKTDQNEIHLLNSFRVCKCWRIIIQYFFFYPKIHFFDSQLKSIKENLMNEEKITFFQELMEKTPSQFNEILKRNHFSLETIDSNNLNILIEKYLSDTSDNLLLQNYNFGFSSLLLKDEKFLYRIAFFPFLHREICLCHKFFFKNIDYFEQNNVFQYYPIFFGTTYSRYNPKSILIYNNQVYTTGEIVALSRVLNENHRMWKLHFSTTISYYFDFDFDKFEIINNDTIKWTPIYIFFTENKKSTNNTLLNVNSFIDFGMSLLKLKSTLTIEEIKRKYLQQMKDEPVFKKKKI